jgi:hypothetical protein
MPLVRTPMIAPTKVYRNVPTLTPDEAADLVVQAIVNKPVRIATRVGIVGQGIHTLTPQVAQIVLNTAFRLSPESDAAAKGGDAVEHEASAELLAMQHLLRGVHL